MTAVWPPRGPRRYKLRGYDVKSLLLAPIVERETGNVIGLVELVNKEIPGSETVERHGKLVRRNSAYGFNDDDERLLRMLCAHCAVFLKHLETEST